MLEGNTGFTSAVWDLGGGTDVDFGFGIDSSLTVSSGWDNATGFGTFHGLTFLNAVAKEQFLSSQDGSPAIRFRPSFCFCELVLPHF